MPKKFTENLSGIGLSVTPEGIIEAIGITADVRNANGRVYPAALLETAILEYAATLNESPGQGSWAPLSGEVEHPEDKSESGRPGLRQTAVRWLEAKWDPTTKQSKLKGRLVGTQAGNDVKALAIEGYRIGVSQRGAGTSTVTKNPDGMLTETVQTLKIRGYDLTGYPSDPQAAITHLESTHEEDEMDPEQLKKLITENPGLFSGLLESVKTANAAQLKALEAQVRLALGIAPDADIASAAQDAIVLRNKTAAKAYLETALKDLPFGELNDVFAESIRLADPADEASAKALFEARKTEYGKVSSKAKLGKMGYKGPLDLVRVIGPLFESETGQPAYAQEAFIMNEAIRRHRDVVKPFDVRNPVTVNDIRAIKYLEMFDKQYSAQLIDEHRRFSEAEQVSDVIGGMPVTVMRAIVPELFATAVALGIFDVGTTSNSPTKIYYEHYVLESGATAVITDESHALTLHGVAMQLASKRLKPGTVVVKVGVTVYDEFTDFVIDYINGTITTLASGTMGASVTTLTSYTYYAYRKGELQPIERAKMQLSSATMEVEADRLGALISTEMILFSRSQVGWDAVGRTLSSLVADLARRIDEGLFYLALASALGLSDNVETWSAQNNTLDELVAKVGVTKVKVFNRFYTPTGLLMSMTNADMVSNWGGFTAAGQFPDSDLNVNGFVGRIKGLPVIQSQVWRDDFMLAFNREIVQYRVYQAMRLDGPHPIYHTDGRMISGRQWFVEEFNGASSLVPQKASVLRLTA